jgi:hypothetical protein
MAKVHSDMVAAVCCTGGVSVTPAADNYIPIPQLTVRATDNQVRYDGLYIEGVGLAVPSAQAGFQNTSALNGCDGSDTAVRSVPPMNLGSTEASMTMTATGCNATVQLVTFNTAGHQTLKNATEIFPFGAANTTVDVTSMLWNFCSRFQKAEQPADFPTTPSPTPAPTTLARRPTPRLSLQHPTQQRLLPHPAQQLCPQHPAQQLCPQRVNQQLIASRRNVWCWFSSLCCSGGPWGPIRQNHLTRKPHSPDGERRFKSVLGALCNSISLSLRLTHIVPTPRPILHRSRRSVSARFCAKK